jgi:hypothetical protein
VSARSFWPPAEAAQFDYETLRDYLLEQGTLPGGLAAARFARRGLAGLIAWPAAEPLFIPEITGADRPRWSPQVATRQDVLRSATSFSSTPPDSRGGQGLGGGAAMRVARYERTRYHPAWQCDGHRQQILASDAERRGSLQGGVVISSLAKLKLARECTAELRGRR